jgi:hypothetical protein
MQCPKRKQHTTPTCTQNTVIVLQELTEFGSVIDVPASEDEATAIVNIPLDVAELVQCTSMKTRQPTFDFSYFTHGNQGNGVSYIFSNCCL